MLSDQDNAVSGHVACMGREKYIQKFKLEFRDSLGHRGASSGVFLFYRDADKSLARPGRKQSNVSVRMA